MLLRAYTSIIIGSLSYRIYQTTSCILQRLQLVSLHSRTSKFFAQQSLSCEANCQRISDVQKLIQNFVKCKKLKSISRKHGSLKFEPVLYVSASMREYTRREY